MKAHGRRPKQNQNLSECETRHVDLNNYTSNIRLLQHYANEFDYSRRMASEQASLGKRSASSSASASGSEMEMEIAVRLREPAEEDDEDEDYDKKKNGK